MNKNYFRQFHLLVAMIITVTHTPLFGEEFRYELKAPELKALMTGKETSLYTKAEKELSKVKSELATTKILFKGDKSLKGVLEKKQKAVTEAEAILTNLDAGVRSRVEAAIPSSRIEFASVPSGLNLACTQFENFATTAGITDLSFAGIWVWKGDRPQMSSELSDAVYARLAESKVKLARLSLAAPDASVKSSAVDAEPSSLLMGEVVDAPQQAAKLVSLRIIDAKRLAVIKSYSWFVPQKPGVNGAVRTLFNDEKALFYKSFVLAHDMKLIQGGAPVAREAYCMALTKQMIADSPNCELIDAPFLIATLGTSLNGKGREANRGKMEALTLVADKDSFHLELTKVEGQLKPVRMGDIKTISVK